MARIDKEEVILLDFNRPLVCLCISVIVGIITFDIFNNFKIGAVLIAALFIILIFIFFDKLVTALCICMMVISFMNTYYYYNMYEESNILEVDRKSVV